MGDLFYFLKRQINAPLLFAIVLTIIRVVTWSPSFLGKTRDRPHQSSEISYFQKWREEFCQIAAPLDTTGLVRGIFLGDASFIPPPIYRDFRIAGLTHVVAASGFNCWIVGFVFLFLTKLLIAPVKKYLPTSKGVIRFLHRTELTVMAMGSWIFYLWTNKSPPVTRAAVMITARNFFVVLEWPVRFTRLLFLQYLLSIAIEPTLFRSASFQLTFACLVGLLLGAKAQKKFLTRTGTTAKKPLPKAVMNYFFSNLGACLSVAPITWIFFAEVNFTSLLTNWFVGLPVALFIMPLGLLTMVTLKISPALAAKSCILNDICCQCLSFLVHEFLRIIPHLMYAPYRDFI